MEDVAFYRDVLGIPFLFAAPPQMAFFDCGGVRLLVGVMPQGQTAQRGSAIYFQVPDIHAVYSSLKDRGVRFKAAPHVAHRTPESELWLSEFTDPDGNQLVLMSEQVIGTAADQRLTSELSQEQEAELERFAQRVVDEAERVGVDWEAATARMRALAETTWTEPEDGAPAELTIGLDMTLLLETLRRLPDGAGTAQFLAAYEAAELDDGPPAA